MGKKVLFGEIQAKALRGIISGIAIGIFITLIVFTFCNLKSNPNKSYISEEIVVEVVDFFWGGFLAKTSDIPPLRSKDFPVMLADGCSVEDVKIGDFLKLRIQYALECPDNPKENHTMKATMYAVVIKTVKD